MSKRQHQSRRTAEERTSASIATIQPQVVAGILLLGVAIFVAYYPALHGGFILDDDRLLTDNTLVQAPDGLARMWFTTDPADYWPVANSSLWLEWRLWGVNTTGYHVTNLVLHCIAALLIWAILRRLKVPGAFLAALLFAVHPVNVESVAWISQRKGLLAAVFLLLSILWYVHAEDRRIESEPNRAWYWLSLLAFVIAMLSKGSVAILPLVLLLVVWWLKRRIDLADVVRSAPFFLVAVVLTGVNVWFQTHGVDMVVRDASVTQRLLGASGAIWFYLSKALAPVDLSFIYPQWNVKTDDIWWWFTLLAASVVTLVLFLWQRKSPASNTARGLLFAWLFFCMALLPIMGFTDVGFMRYSLVADHYQYIAVIAVAAVAAAALRSVATPVAIVVVGILAFVAWQQSRLYADAITLYRATLVRNPECWLIENNLGSALFDVDQLPEAVRHYRRALELNPKYAEAHDNLGVTLEKTASSQEAITEFREALRLKSDYAKAHFDLGHVLTNSGHAQEGIEEYQQAVRLNPNYAEAYYNLGLAFSVAGNFEQAMQKYQEALRLRPDYVAAIQNLGNVLLSSGQVPAAIEQYQKALRLQPENAEVHNNLGVALVRRGLLPEAVVQYELALRFRPDYASPRTNLGKALELARAQGLTELSQQIESLLNANGGQKNN